MKTRLADKLLPTLYEDDGLVAVTKPSGVDTGGLAEQSTPGLVELLSTVRKLDRPLEPVNRLSRYESGILLLAKKPFVAGRLRAAWKAMGVEQEYVAVVRGRMSKPMLVLGAREEKSRGAPSRKPATRPKRPGKKPNRPQTDSSATSLRRIAQTERRALIQCKTRASTTHALRAQLRSVGLRLLGDRLHDRSPRPAADRDTCLHLAGVRIAAREGQAPITLRCPPPRAFQTALAAERDFERPLLAALTRRLPCLLETDTDSFRLLTGPAENVPGLIVEKFGQVLVFQLLDPPAKLAEALPRIAEWYRDMLGIESAYLKRFVKNRTAQDAELERSLRSPRPFFGKPAPEKIHIKERGARFVIRPFEGFSVGLFLDQRDNRSRLGELAAGKEVLNVFAYTCGFSVAAALGGAKQTVSVDVSTKHLEWGKENFAVNRIDLTNHLFFRSDAMEFLERTKRQGRLFDIVVLDPPSFAHGRRSKGDFSVLTDLPALVSAASGVLRENGVLMVSVNHRRMSHGDLRSRIHSGLGGRTYELLISPQLPPDFAIDPDHSKSRWIRLGPA